MPDANFYLGDLSQQPWNEEIDRYDLVVACEVLYYISDVHKTLKMMNHLGESCFITFFAPEAYKLSAIVDSVPGAHKSWLSHDRTTWLVAWWESTRNTLIGIMSTLIFPAEYLLPAISVA